MRDLLQQQQQQQQHWFLGSSDYVLPTKISPPERQWVAEGRPRSKWCIVPER